MNIHFTLGDYVGTTSVMFQWSSFEGPRYTDCTEIRTCKQTYRLINLSCLFGPNFRCWKTNCEVISPGFSPNLPTPFVHLKSHMAIFQVHGGNLAKNQAPRFAVTDFGKTYWNWFCDIWQTNRSMLVVVDTYKYHCFLKHICVNYGEL